MTEVKFACPHCGQHLEAPEEVLGTVVECPSCNKQIQVPRPAPIASPPPLSPTPPNRRRHLVPIIATVVGVLLIAGAVVYFPHFSQVIDKFKDYKPCNPVFNFTLGDTTCGGTEKGGWELQTFKKLYVNNKEIPVRATTVEKGGFISTKGFGKIIIRIDEVGMRGTKIQVLTTPRQEKLLADFLGIKEATATDGNTQASIKSEVTPKAYTGTIRTAFNLDKLRASAESGDVKAQGALASRYATGQGVPKDYHKAFIWFLKAAEQGDTKAQSNLALCYTYGRGVAKDRDEAKKWHLKAIARDGASSAESQNTSQDHNNNVESIRKLAEQGDANAQFRLGARYDKGEGVPHDVKEAVKWFRKAADQGDSYAQCNLGICYAKGDGILQDYREAMNWCLKAAEQGNANAMINVGSYYWDGSGVDKDFVEAYKWVLLASKQDSTDAVVNANAIRNVTMLKSHLTSEQIAEGEKRSNDWLRRNQR